MGYILKEPPHHRGDAKLGAGNGKRQHRTGGNAEREKSHSSRLGLNGGLPCPNGRTRTRKIGPPTPQIHDFAALDQLVLHVTLQFGQEFSALANCCRHLVIPELRALLQSLDRLGRRTSELTRQGEAPCRLEPPGNNPRAV